MLPQLQRLLPQPAPAPQQAIQGSGAATPRTRAADCAALRCPMSRPRSRAGGTELPGATVAEDANPFTAAGRGGLSGAPHAASASSPKQLSRPLWIARLYPPGTQLTIHHAQQRAQHHSKFMAEPRRPRGFVHVFQEVEGKAACCTTPHQNARAWGVTPFTLIRLWHCRRR